MITLTKEEYIEFLAIYHSLLYYVGRAKGVISKKITFDKFLYKGLKLKFECREALYADIGIIDEYLKYNQDHLGVFRTSIVHGFKKFKKDKFLILKSLTHNAIFLNSKLNEVYAVKALGNTFDELVDHYPILANTVLLPFNGQIICDGFFQSNNVYFGPGIRGTFTDCYKQAKRRKSIISTL